MRSAKINKKTSANKVFAKDGLNIFGENLVAVIDKNHKVDKVPYKIISLNEIQNYEYDFIVISVIGREIDIIKNLMEYNNIDIKKVIIL